MRIHLRSLSRCHRSRFRVIVFRGSVPVRLGLRSDLRRRRVAGAPLVVIRIA